MFNSKSVLSAFDKGRLVFECDQIALWCEANSGGYYAAWPRLDLLPVTLLGEGNYGAAYRLTNWPGLVLKLCRNPEDGYPLYIKAIANAKHHRAWMPVVFAYGGDDTMDGKMFWCVLPEYENPAGVGHGSQCGSYAWEQAGGDHIERLVSLTTHPGHRMNRRANFPATKAAEAAAVAAGGYRWDVSPVYDHTGARREASLPKPERRMYRQMRQLFKDIGVTDTYCHAGNALKDGDQWIILDPVPGVSSYRKAKTYANRQW